MLNDYVAWVAGIIAAFVTFVVILGVAERRCRWHRTRKSHRSKGVIRER